MPSLGLRHLRILHQPHPLVLSAISLLAGSPLLCSGPLINQQAFLPPSQVRRLTDRSGGLDPALQGLPPLYPIPPKVSKPSSDVYLSTPRLPRVLMPISGFPTPIPPLLPVPPLTYQPTPDMSPSTSVLLPLPTVDFSAVASQQLHCDHV